MAVSGAIAGLGMSGPAAAGRYINTIDDELTLNPSGKKVVVTGPIGCDAGEIVTIYVTVIQESTGAVADGRFTARCTGDREQETTQPWTAHAAARGPVAFEEGPAEVTAEAVTRDRGQITDRVEWSKTVNLVQDKAA